MNRKPVIALVVLAGLCVAASAGAGAQLLFEDYFTGQLKNWDSYSCCWNTQGWENGHLLRQKSAEPKLVNTKALIAVRSFGDCVVETKVRFGLIPSTDTSKDEIDRLGAGILFGYQDENNYFLFRLAGDRRVVLGKVVQGEWKSLGEKEALTPRSPLVGQLEDAPWHTLKVTFREGGRKITAEVDGSSVLSADGEQQWGTGRIGLTTFKSMADFAYVRVSAAD